MAKGEGKNSYTAKCRGGAICHVISMWVLIAGIILLIVGNIDTINLTNDSDEGARSNAKAMVISGYVLLGVGVFSLIGSTVYLLYKKCYKVVIFFIIANMFGLPV